MTPLQRLLRRSPAARGLLRRYLRHAPTPLVSPRLLARTLHCYQGTQPFVARTRSGSLIAGDTTDLLQRLIYLCGVWEPSLTGWLGRTLGAGDVFVDVGANIGYFSLLASTLVGDGGRVVAIESSPSIFEQLLANLALNEATNVRPVQGVASNATGVSQSFRAHAGNLGASSTFAAEGFEDEGAVAAAPLSELLTPAEVSRARVIKVDVEGAEVEVIEGLVPVLDAARQELEIVVEVGGGPPGTRRADESVQAIARLLGGRGFNVYRVHRDSTDAAAFAHKVERRPPQRVRDLAAIVAETDLIYSRRDQDTL